jgi:hypothetical protein
VDCGVRGCGTVFNYRVGALEVCLKVCYNKRLDLLALQKFGIDLISERSTFFEGGDRARVPNGGKRSLCRSSRSGSSCFASNLSNFVSSTMIALSGKPSVH